MIARFGKSSLRRAITRRAAFIVGAAIAAGGCEGWVGIRDAVLFEDAGGVVRDGSIDVLDGGDTDAGGDTGGDAGLPRELRFEAIAVACSSGAAFDVDLARSEPGSLQDRAIIALEFGSIWICRDPLGEPVVDEIPFDTSGAQAMWVGDLNRSGTDDVAMIEVEGRFFVVELQADGNFDVTPHQTDYGSGTSPAFLTGAELSDSGLPDVVMVKGSVSLLRQTDGVFVNDFLAELTPPDDAVFTSFESPDVPDIVALGAVSEAVELAVLRANGGESFYERQEFHPIAAPTGNLQAVTGDDGLLSFLLVPTSDGIAVLGRDGTALSEPTYLDLDIVGPTAAGDLDGDGIDDLVGVRESGSEGALWLSSSFAGNLDELELVDVDLSEPPTAFAIDDVDGDGLADLIAAGSSGVTVYRQLP